jgi:hypothetical protein
VDGRPGGRRRRSCSPRSCPTTCASASARCRTTAAGSPRSPPTSTSSPTPSPQVTPRGDPTRDATGAEVDHEVDVIVYATGFHANRYLWPMEIVGRDGGCCRSSGATTPPRCLGHHVPELPQPVLPVRAGHQPRPRRQPDLPLGVPGPLRDGLPRPADRRRARTMEVRQEAHDDYNERLQDELSRWSGATRRITTAGTATTPARSTSCRRGDSSTTGRGPAVLPGAQNP